jgi:hypothetical protein
VSDVQHGGLDGVFKKKLGEGGLRFLIGLVMFLRVREQSILEVLRIS